MEFFGLIWCIFLLLASIIFELSKSNMEEQSSVVFSKSQDSYYSLNWILKKSKNDRYEVIFKTSVDGDINWIGFGFASQSHGKNQFDKDEEDADIVTADWFIAWKDRKERVHFKDCNTMKYSLHFDGSQDYHVISKKRPTTLNLTVKRLLDTYDDYDVQIKAGKMSIVWAYGNAKSFSRIRSEIRSAENNQDLVLFSEFKTDNVSNEADKLQRKTEDADDKTKIQATAEKIVQPSVANSTVLISQKKNCTVIIEENTHWYEILKLKQENVFYAIIGSSAIFASIIVFILACCCAKKSRPQTPHSKVAFYKVDDYDEEQVEFLKERA